MTGWLNCDTPPQKTNRNFGNDVTTANDFALSILLPFAICWVGPIAPPFLQWTASRARSSSSVPMIRVWSGVLLLLFLIVVVRSSRKDGTIDLAVLRPCLFSFHDRIPLSFSWLSAMLAVCPILILFSLSARLGSARICSTRICSTRIFVYRTNCHRYLSWCRCWRVGRSSVQFFCFFLAEKAEIVKPPANKRNRYENRGIVVKKSGWSRLVLCGGMLKSGYKRYECFFLRRYTQERMFAVLRTKCKHLSNCFTSNKGRTTRLFHYFFILELLFFRII